jgi:hypothetical protein
MSVRFLLTLCTEFKIGAVAEMSYREGYRQFRIRAPIFKEVNAQSLCTRLDYVLQSESTNK